MTVRLATKFFVSAMIRETQARGGSAVIVAKGDSESGAILLVGLEKGRASGIFQLVLGSSGRYRWADIRPEHVVSAEQVDQMCAKRRSVDPDLWVVELDIPNPERFIVDFIDRN